MDNVSSLIDTSIKALHERDSERFVLSLKDIAAQDTETVLAELFATIMDYSARWEATGIPENDEFGDSGVPAVVDAIKQNSIESLLKAAGVNSLDDAIARLLAVASTLRYGQPNS